MPFLAVGGTTVPVVTDRPATERVPVGSVEPAYNGAPRSSVSGYKTRWTGIRTKPLPISDAETIRALLEAAPPLTLTGDLTGSTTGYAVNIRYAERGRFLVAGVNTEHVVLEFDLWEA